VFDWVEERSEERGDVRWGCRLESLYTRASRVPVSEETAMDKQCVFWTPSRVRFMWLNGRGCDGDGPKVMEIPYYGSGSGMAV
jgi:hypothetical protein